MRILFYTKLIIVAICLFYSCYTDITTRKIKNYITFPLMIFGIIINIIDVGILNGLKTSFGGMLVIFAFCIIFSLIGGIGFGDTKLLMGIGSVYGLFFAIDTLLFALLSMVLYFFIFKFKDLKKLTTNLTTISLLALSTKKLPELEQKESAWTVPYACFITFGFFVSILLFVFLKGSFTESLIIRF